MGCYTRRMDGDANIASVAALFGDKTRARILLALADGRALPASVLAREAGVAGSTASGHLGQLTQAGLLSVESWGRHRYYRLAGADVAAVLESLAHLAPRATVRSLRGSARLRALRQGRTCYDHLAGRLGTALMEALLRQGILVGGDGRFHPEAARADCLSAPGRDIDYRLTTEGEHRLNAFGVDPRPEGKALTVRYCVDWSEQRHHLAGGLGASLLKRLEALEWIRRAPRGRAVALTPAGARGLRDVFALADPHGEGEPRTPTRHGVPPRAAE